jgi:ATP-binding protein involved in chromosome partitioning
MDADTLEAAVTAALSKIAHPATGEDLVSSGQAHDIAVDEAGIARFSFALRPDDPGHLVKEARAAAEGVEGIASVKVNVQLPSTGGAPAGSQGRGGLEPGSVPAPTPAPNLLPGVARVVAVSSGKGGVGKSMVSANLAVALAAKGLRVGLLDADVYGPNIPLMFGEEGRPRVSGEQGNERIEPIEAHGVKLMSLGFLLDRDQPAIMRGPLISGILKQFLEQVHWGELDLMLVDMPPGTGDAQLSLVQTIDLDGAVMVTTPQDVATSDVRRGVRMFERVNTRLLGLVENMSGFTCPSCGEAHEVFGRGGGRDLAVEMSLPFLGEVPLDSEVRAAGDAGTPTVASAPDSPAGSALRSVADALLSELEA